METTTAKQASESLELTIGVCQRQIADAMAGILDSIATNPTQPRRGLGKDLAITHKSLDAARLGAFANINSNLNEVGWAVAAEGLEMSLLDRAIAMAEGIIAPLMAHLKDALSARNVNGCPEDALSNAREAQIALESIAKQLQAMKTAEWRASTAVAN